MIKVLFIHPHLSSGGAEELRLTILKYMDRTRFNIDICCIGKKGVIGKEIESMGYDVYELNSSDKFYDIRTTLKLGKFIKAKQYDIVQSSLFNTNIHGRIAAKLAGVPVVISEEHSDYERYNIKIDPFMRNLNRWLAKVTDRITTCSEQVKMSLSSRENIPIDKFIVLHNAVDPEKFVLKQSANDVREKFNIKRGDKVIGYIANFGVRKGHIYLLDAFQNVKSRLRNVKLVMVGGGDFFRKKLEDRASILGMEEDIIFMETRRDIPAILNMIDLFVSPAIEEAFGIGLLEAMCAGIPCVAADVGGVSEVVQNGITGILVPSKNPKRMADAIVKILTDTEMAKIMGMAGRERAIKKFSPQGYVSKLESMYEELIREKL